MPDISAPMTDDIEGVYESDLLSTVFKHFMITRDVSSDELISLKYRGSKRTTDDPKKSTRKRN